MRSITNFKPKGSGEFPYSPQRDVAYLTPPLLREVFRSLDPDNWSEADKDLFEKYAITVETLSQATGLFMQGMRLFLRHPEVKSAADAFKDVGFEDLHPVVQNIIYSRIGGSVVAGYFTAVREVTMQGELTPAHEDFTAMLASIREAYQRLLGLTPIAHDTYTYTQQVESIKEMHLVIQQQQNTIIQITEEFVEKELKLQETVRKQASQIAALHEQIEQQLSKTSFFRKVTAWLRPKS